jgi:hypothetical protein
VLCESGKMCIYVNKYLQISAPARVGDERGKPMHLLDHSFARRITPRFILASPPTSFSSWAFSYATLLPTSCYPGGTLARPYPFPNCRIETRGVRLSLTAGRPWPWSAGYSSTPHHSCVWPEDPSSASLARKRPDFVSRYSRRESIHVSHLV